jgi:hypothetical protein
MAGSHSSYGKVNIGLHMDMPGEYPIGHPRQELGRLTEGGRAEKE